MKNNWNNIKYDFLEHINKYKITNFINFNESLRHLSNELKGQYFEYFCKLFFELDTLTKSNYKKIYLYTEIPLKLKKELNLPLKDKGIDCIAIDNDNIVYAIQVKYRTSNKKIIPFNELATFQALTFGTNVKINNGIFFSNCYECCYELSNDKYTHILYDTLESKCDNLFWLNVREYIGNKQITKYEPLKPLDHQINIISACKKHYLINKNGRLYLACGTGKTFIGYWISVRELEYNKIFIVVPSLYLLSQTYETWFKETQYDEDKYHFILIGSDMDSKDDLCCYKPTTNIDIIKDKLNNYEKVITICTYQSSDILINACRELNYTFDFGVYDEAHRTVGLEDKCFSKLINSNIESKRIFMTATEKIFTNKLNKKIFSMDNERIYGKVIYRYSMRNAIEDNVLVDYRIVAPFLNSNKYVDQILNNNMINYNNTKYDVRLMLTGLMVINCIKEYNIKHLLIFSNTNERAKNIIEFIENYINNTNHPLKNKINCKYLSGNDSMTIRKGEVIDFENSDIGIISSARIFGEGVDIKICDAICFADGKNSAIDIVQYVGRCLRKCNLLPNKLSYILIPFVLDDYDNFFDYENDSYLKLRKILKTIGMTDDLVTEKFSILDLNNKYKFVGRDTKDIIYCNDKNIIIDVNEFTNNVISKIFDKSGDIIDRTRNILIFENKKRYENGEELIDTKNKILKYLADKNIELNNTPNWIKYALGDKLFNIIKNNYYYSIDDFKFACKKNKIISVDTYKRYYPNDKKLPSYEYINNGFYYNLDNKFNLTFLLSDDTYDNEF